MKIVPTHIIENCIFCGYSSGLETHSEDHACCNHDVFDEYPDGMPFDDTTGNIPDWCPLEDA